MVQYDRKTGFRHMGKQDTDQLRGNREADQRLCLRYTDSIIPLLPKFSLAFLAEQSRLVCA